MIGTLCFGLGAFVFGINIEPIANAVKRFREKRWNETADGFGTYTGFKVARQKRVDVKLKGQEKPTREWSIADLELCV